MSRLRRFSLKFVVFALAPTLALLLAAETAVRVKYFLAHGYEWAYLAAPFVHGSLAAPERWTAVRPDPTTASSKPDTDSSKNQMVFKWKKPCADSMVYSTELQRDVPRTFDDNCFRGDRVTTEKTADEYRIVFLGGSTVEDAQSDSEMWTARFKRAWPPTYLGKRVTVVNAGKSGFESRRILLYWGSWVQSFSPDLVLYYEAWNEQPTSVKWVRVDERVAAFRNWFHETLYYRSMLYTYMVEKFAFLSTSNDHFWKLDVTDVRNLRISLTSLAGDVRSRGIRFVFVTQVIQFPRMWKGVDTFDYHAVDALLDRLKADRHYVYDAREISALNQRLALFYSLELCRQNDIPVINILDPIEALGEDGCTALFVDLGHLSVKGDQMVGELVAARLH